MRVCALGVAVLLFCAAAGAASTSTNFVVPTTTLAIQTGNNTSTAHGFTSQTNGNAGAGNVSKVNVHSLLYSGATTRVYAHLLLWFGGSNHMNVGYSSTDPAQIHKQIMDMISRGIDGVVIDWYGPGTTIDYATQLVVTEVEKHPGFTFAIMVDQGAIEWDSCKGCTPTQALTADLQYLEQTYFPSKAYLTLQGLPVVTSFGIDDSYTIDWNAVNSALATTPLYLFQNSKGFTHVLSDGGYSWVMPTTTDYGMSYLTSFYQTGISLPTEQTVGVTYKGFNDTLAAWGSNRVMGQQCGRTWLQTFNKINSLYTASKQLPFVQLVTWNDYEEGTEIESGISNCLTISAKVSANALTWSIAGNGSTVDHYVTYISTDGNNLMPLTNSASGTNSLNLCSFGVPNGNYVLYVQAVGKPTLTNQISAGVPYTSTCGGPGGSANLNFTATPSIVTLSSGGSGNITIAATPESGAFNSVIDLACVGLPSDLTCSFAPAAIVPGNITARSILTISTVSIAADWTERRIRSTLATSLSSIGMFGLALVGGIQRKRLFQVTGLWVLVLLVLGGTSCGGGISKTSRSTFASPASYAVTVSGSATGAQVSTSITVTVQ
jgi:hypothetical protein